MTKPIGRFTAAAVGGAAFLVYVFTCCRTVFVGDSGELTLILSTGGIAHPPGYPLFTILGFLWLKLLFFLTPVVAANLFSAVTTAGAVAILYLILERTGGDEVSPWLNAGVALFFAFSRPIWSSATNAEVYGLAALLFVAALYLIIRYHQTGVSSALISAAFFCGLTMTHHFSSVVVASGLVVAMYLRRKELSFPPIIAAAIAFLAPLTLYVYLLVRFDPGLPINWMTDKSMAGLWGMVTADIYQEIVALPTAGDIWHCLIRLGKLLATGFGPGLILLALPGAVGAVRRKSLLTLIFMLPMIFNIIMVSFYRIPDCEGYLVPLFVAAVFLLRESARLVPGRFLAKRWLPGILAAVIVVLPLGFNYSICDISGFRLAERYGRDLLDSAPEEGLVFLKSDNGSHTALYLHFLENYRPDLEVYATYSTMARLTGRFGKGDYPRIVDSLDRTTTRVFRGAEYIINQGAPPGNPGRELVGFLYGPGGAGTKRAVQMEQRIGRFIHDSLDLIDLRNDLKARQIYLEYRLWEIDRMMRGADQATVTESIDRLREWGKRIDDPYACLAVSQFFRMRGATDEALTWVDIASTEGSGSFTRRDININLASIRRQRGEMSEAAAALETALKIDPASTAARYNLNLLKVEWALQRKDYPAALEASAELTRLEPDNPLPYFNIGVIYDRLPGGQKKAFEAYSEFLRLAGNDQYPEVARRARERIDLLTSELERP